MITDDLILAQLGKVENSAANGVQNTVAIYRLLHAHAETSLLLAGRQACWALPRGKRMSSLSDAEFKVFSQFGEDGIIEWLISHVDVPSRRFVEFGVQSFQEANCRFLMRNRNWRGLIMDGSEANIAAAQQDPSYWQHELTAIPAFITAENINSLLVDAGFTDPLGILSIDVDGNDYWIWDAIDVVSPGIVVCEYNGILGDTQPISIPYKPKFTRFDGHFSGYYFGCSITALIHLATKRGYTFVGTASNAINAFFVRNDLAQPVLDLLDQIRAFPPHHRDSRDEAGRLSYVGGLERLELIRHLPVINVVTGQSLLIGDIAAPYSEAWLDEIA